MFSSYISGRKQVVKFHQETTCAISCGVPQGVGSSPNFVLVIYE